MGGSNPPRRIKNIIVIDMDFSKKLKAIELRRKGLSYSEISNSITVSKSTLSRWLKDIKLSKKHKSRLSKLQATGYIGAKTNQAKALLHHKRIKETAKIEAIKLSKRPFFIAGLMLYWAEGGKNFSQLQFSNSDPDMIKLMMKWFRKFCNVPEEKFRVGLFIHTLHVRRNCLDFWSKITGLPLEQFNKPYIKPTIFSNRKNKLYEGTCVIKVHSNDLLSKMLGWIEGAKITFNV